MNADTKDKIICSLKPVLIRHITAQHLRACVCVIECYCHVIELRVKKFNFG